MPDQPAPPPVRVLLPDGEQQITGRLHARQQTTSGWRYWIGVPLWQNVGPEGEGIEPAEYRVWLSDAQARPIDGITYDVPTHRLSTEPPQAPDARWAWTVQRLRGPTGRPADTVVHDWECEHSPGGAAELNLDQALTALEQPGARACKTCGAAVVLTPLLGGPAPDTD